MIKNSLSNSFCFISEDISKLVFRNDAVDMPPVFSMFGSIAKFKAIRFQITRLFGALKQILPLHPNRSTCNLITLTLLLLPNLGLNCLSVSVSPARLPSRGCNQTILFHSPYLSIYPSICPSIHPSTHPSIHPPLSQFLPRRNFSIP